MIKAFSRIVRLGEGLTRTGALSDEAMDRAVGALAVCADKLRRRKVSLARSVATEACRRATNGSEFAERVHGQTGIVLDIIEPADCLTPSAKDYRAANNEALGKSEGRVPLEPRAVSQSIGDLVPHESVKFKRGGAEWQRTRRQVLEAFREEFADDLVANFKPSHIDIILARKMQKAGGKGGTHAAKRLREQLEALFAFAVKLEWIRT